MNLRLALPFAVLIAVANLTVCAQSPPASPQPRTETQQTPSANNAAVVWVNTDSHIYHKPGTRYYGKTKHGKYMLESDAIKAGYRDSGKN